MILEVSRNKSKVANCYCDAMLYDNYALILISLFGSTNSVRSIWAKLRGDYGSVYVGSESVSLSKNFRYMKMQSPLKDPGASHIVLIEEHATHQIANASEFYQIGEDSAESFFTRLDKLCSVPFRKSWSTFLWEKGLEGEAIRELEGFGMKGFRVSTNEEKWSEIVLSGLKDGQLR